MVEKTAIAVFNPQDPIEAALQEGCHKHTGKYMTAHEMRILMKAMWMYRGLATKLRTNPHDVANIIFGEHNDRPYWYHPCDIVELRTLLHDRQIAWHAPIMLFGIKTAQKLMPQYPICLVLDRNEVKQIGRQLGGMILVDTARLHFGDALKRIMVRPYLTEKQIHTINTIIKETYGYVPVHLLQEIPGLAYEKVADAGNTKEITGGVPMSNWFSKLTQAAGPDETYNKPFLIGRLPKERSQVEDIEQTQYESPKESLDWKPGDRGVFRYTDVNLNMNGGAGARTKAVPVTRSLLEKPKAFTVKSVDDSHIHILMDGAKEEQKIPIDEYMFLVKLR